MRKPRKRKQKTWNTREEIEADINRAQATCNQLTQTMLLKAKLAENYRRTGDSYPDANARRVKAVQLQEDADRLQRSIDRIEKRVLPKLKRAMGEMETEPMPFVDGKVAES